MKKKIQLLFFIVVLFVMDLPYFADAQQWSGSNKNTFWNNWSLNVNAGMTSYYGDLSYYDSDLLKKLQNESGPAFGIIISKFLIPSVGISGQMLHGHFKGGNNNVAFKTSFLEYNIQACIDFVQLFVPDSPEKFSVNGYAGIGQSWFKTASYVYNEGRSVSNNQQTEVPEFVIVFGTGLSYEIASNLSVTVDFALRSSQNDMLDNYTKNNNNDFYSYTNVGLTYCLKNLKKSDEGHAKSGIRQDKTKKYNRLVSN